MMDHEAIRQALATHALHAIDPEDRTGVEHELLEHVAGCDECLQMMRDFRELGGDLALAAVPIPVDPALEKRIIASIREERPSPSVVPRRRRFLGVASVATAVALVGSLGWNAALLGRAGHAERRSASLSAAVHLASDPATRSVSLRGERGGIVLLYKPGGKAALFASDVPAPPAGKLYELWLLKDGTTTPVVVFRPAGRLVIIDVPINPATFRGAAITIETRFEQEPTTPQLYAGSIGA